MSEEREKLDLEIELDQVEETIKRRIGTQELLKKHSDLALARLRNRRGQIIARLEKLET